MDPNYPGCICVLHLFWSSSQFMTTRRWCVGSACRSPLHYPSLCVNPSTCLATCLAVLTSSVEYTMSYGYSDNTNKEIAGCCSSTCEYGGAGTNPVSFSLHSPSAYIYQGSMRTTDGQRAQCTAAIVYVTELIHTMISSKSGRVPSLSAPYL